MSSNPPLPFDPYSQTDCTGWMEMINSIVGFVTASTHLATTLRNSGCCFPEVAEITEVQKRRKNIEYYNPLDFPWFLKVLGTVSTAGQLQDQKSVHYRICEVVPLVQYPLFDGVRGEPNLEPRTFTLVDTKDFGDVDFKPTPTINNKINSFNSDPSVLTTKTILKYNSDDSCFFDEYTDSEQTIDSTNLQEYFEKREEQLQQINAQSSEKSLEIFSLKTTDNSFGNCKSEHALEKLEEIEQYSTIYPNIEGPTKRVDLYMECIVEDAKVVSKKKLNDDENLFSPKSDGSQTVATHDDIMHVMPKSEKIVEEEQCKADVTKAASSLIEIVHLTPRINSIVEKKSSDPNKMQVVSESADIRQLALDIDEEKLSRAVKADEEDTKPEFVRAKKDKVLNNKDVTTLSAPTEDTKIVPILTINGKKKGSRAEKRKPAPASTQYTQDVPEKTRKGVKKVPNVNENENIPTRELKENQSSNLKNVTKMVPKQICKEIEKAVTLIPIPIILQDPRVEAKTRVKNGKLQSKKEPQLPKDVKRDARQEKEGGTDFITKNIVNCLQTKRRIGKALSEDKQNLSKPFPNSVFTSSKDRFSGKGSATSNQPKNASVGEAKASNASERKSLSADEVKPQTATKSSHQRLSKRDNARKPVTKTASHSEKPVMPESMRKIRSCLKSAVSKGTGTEGSCMFQEDVEIHTKRPVTCTVTVRHKKEERILPKMPLIRDTTLKLTAAETVKKASELLKNVEENVLRPTTEIKRKVISGSIRPVTVCCNRKW